MPSSRSPWRRFWAPDRLAWWVAVLFLVGSVLFVGGVAFAAGSYLMLPELFSELDRQQGREDEVSEPAG